MSAQIKAFIILVHKLVNSIVIECCHLRLQSCTGACMQFLVIVEALNCEWGLMYGKKWKSLRIRSRLFGECSNSSHPKPCKNHRVWMAVWWCALSWMKKILQINFPRRMFCIAFLNLECFTASVTIYCFNTCEEIYQKLSLPFLENSRHDLSWWKYWQAFPWFLGRSYVTLLYRLVLSPRLISCYDITRPKSDLPGWL